MRTLVLIVALNSCGPPVTKTTPATVQYITASEASALLAFVPETGGYRLVRCNNLAELTDNRCRTLSQLLTVEQLTEVRDKLEAELTALSSSRSWLLPALLAVASVVVSKAVVRDLIKVVPITFAVGIVLTYSQKQLLRVVQFHDEKQIIVEELQDFGSEHRSSTSLIIIEEVLLSYLRAEIIGINDQRL